jgi:hypothetical protein
MPLSFLPTLHPPRGLFSLRRALVATGVSVALAFGVLGTQHTEAASLDATQNGNRWTYAVPATQDNAGQRDPVGALFAAAQNHGVNPYVLINIVRLESGFNPYAVGDHGMSLGLIQLHQYGLRRHFYAMGYTDVFSAEQSADYLARVASGEFRRQGVTLSHWTAARWLGYY